MHLATAGKSSSARTREESSASSSWPGFLERLDQRLWGIWRNFKIVLRYYGRKYFLYCFLCEKTYCCSRKFERFCLSAVLCILSKQRSKKIRKRTAATKSACAPTSRRPPPRTPACTCTRRRCGGRREVGAQVDFVAAAVRFLIFLLRSLFAQDAQKRQVRSNRNAQISYCWQYKFFSQRKQ